MLDALRAETLKLSRHRATWMMVWIYPIGVSLILAFLLGRDILIGPAATVPTTAADWIGNSTIVWSAPQSGIGRFLIAGFASLVFAGEYGWNTWKLIIPARRRWQLVAAKWAASAGLVLAGFVIADLIGLATTQLRAFIGAAAIPEGVTLSGTLAAHASAMGAALVPIAYTVAFAGLFAVMTTSILASVILSIAMLFLEQLLLPIGLLASAYAPSLSRLVLEILPFYHMANVVAWTKGPGLALPLDAVSRIALPWSTSLAAVIAWTAVAGIATMVRFDRQDLN